MVTKGQFYDDLVNGRKVAISFMFSNCEKACPTIAANFAVCWFDGN
jgi:cytochrome oxidase Cu insertion factor (SCO1/SenC/PrrC family)